MRISVADDVARNGTAHPSQRPCAGPHRSGVYQRRTGEAIGIHSRNATGRRVSSRRLPHPIGWSAVLFSPVRPPVRPVALRACACGQVCG